MPSQVGQAPSGRLKEKCDGDRPGAGGEQVADDVGQLGVGGRIGARVVADRALVDQHGLERRAFDRPAADRLAGVQRGDQHILHQVLLPEPETPVITVSRPRGIGTSISCRLRRCAPRTVRKRLRRRALAGQRPRARAG